MARLLMQRVTWRSMTLIFAESGLLLVSVMAGAYLALGERVLDPAAHAWSKALLFAVICQLCLYYGDLYDLRIVTDRQALFVRLLQRVKPILS